MTVKKTLTTWMPNNDPARPWKTRRWLAGPAACRVGPCWYAHTCPRGGTSKARATPSDASGQAQIGVALSFLGCGRGRAAEEVSNSSRPPCQRGKPISAGIYGHRTCTRSSMRAMKVTSARTRRLPVGAEVQPGGGTHFRVWAPRAERVDVMIESPRLHAIELYREDSGYFAGPDDD